MQFCWHRHAHIGFMCAASPVLQVGTRRPWWYLLSRSYWRPRPADQVAALRRVVQEVRGCLGGLVPS